MWKETVLHIAFAEGDSGGLPEVYEGQALGAPAEVGRGSGWSFPLTEALALQE